MVLGHNAGEKLFIDFSGKTLSHINIDIGEVVHDQVFVACLPYPIIKTFGEENITHNQPLIFNHLILIIYDANWITINPSCSPNGKKGAKGGKKEVKLGVE